METRSGTRFVCRVSEDEIAEFRDLCVLMNVSRGEPMYAVRLAREFGPDSWRALRDADIQGNA